MNRKDYFEFRKKHAYFGHFLISKKMSNIITWISPFLFAIIVLLLLKIDQNQFKELTVMIVLWTFLLSQLINHPVKYKPLFEEDVLVNNSFTNDPEYLYILKVSYDTPFLFNDYNAKEVTFLAINDKNLNDPNGKFIQKTLKYDDFKKSYNFFDVPELVNVKLKNKISTIM